MYFYHPDPTDIVIMLVIVLAITLVHKSIRRHFTKKAYGRPLITNNAVDVIRVRPPFVTQSERWPLDLPTDSRPVPLTEENSPKAFPKVC